MARTREPQVKKRATSVPKKHPAPPVIDKGKLRDRLRIIGDERVFYLLDDMLEVLSPKQLAKIVAQYIDLKQIAPDVESRRGKSTLVADVRAFEEKSRRGAYYEDFRVNSRNYTEKSRGTRSFIADCNRLLERCVRATAKKGDVGEICTCFELIFDLLSSLDEGNDDIVFFADEAGSWQVGVDWDAALHAWIACLTKSARPDDYARRLVEVVDTFEHHDRRKHFAVARKLGDEHQRRALAAAIKATASS